MSNPKVSVCVPTYNHAKYIARMIDGALAQTTRFDFEIVIGDDGSRDGSQEIISGYQQQYPGQIRAFLHETNLGPSEPKEFAGRNNVIFLLKACRGEYVALCEGDDYWTDPRKLQKQVDFLDSHPDYAICHHDLLVTYEDGSPSHSFNPSNQKTDSSIEDILRDNWFIGTASLMYRNYFRNDDFAEWHQYAAAGDWALTIQLAARGPIRYLPEIMGVYRKHRGGLSNVHSQTNRFFLENRKEMFHNVNEWLSKKYDSTVQKTISYYDKQLKSL